MSSLLSCEWKPPRISGEVPAWYSGPIYYRQITTSGPPGPKLFGQFIKFKKRKIAGVDVVERFGNMDSLFKARLAYPEMFGPEGALLPEWLEPLKAEKKANFPKKWDNLNPGFLQLMSERVKCAIEKVEPGRHIFVPVDVEPDDGDPGRVYIFKTGQGGYGYRALDNEFNPDGRHFSMPPQVLNSDFALLDPAKINDWQWFECEVGLVRSQEMIQELGDTLPEKVLLVPIGVRS